MSQLRSYFNRLFSDIETVHTRMDDIVSNGGGGGGSGLLELVQDISSSLHSRMNNIMSHPLLSPVTNHTLNLNNNPNYIPPSGEIIYTSTLYGEYEDWINLPFKINSISSSTNTSIDSITIVFDTASVHKNVNQYLRVGDRIRIQDVFIPIENVYFSVECIVAWFNSQGSFAVKAVSGTAPPLMSLNIHQRNALVGERIQLRRLL